MQPERILWAIVAGGLIYLAEEAEAEPETEAELEPEPDAEAEGSVGGGVSIGGTARSVSGMTSPSRKNGAAKYCGHSPGLFVIDVGAYCAR